MKKALGIITTVYIILLAMSIESIANYSLLLLVILVIIELLLIAIYALIEHKKIK